MIFQFWLLAIIQLSRADNFEIEDIPIEHFEHAEAQSDAFDVELMPRSSRSLFPNFGYRTLQEDIPQLQDKYKLTDFEHLFENVPVTTLRKKRNVDTDQDILRELGKPLELAVIEPEAESKDVSSLATTSRKLNDRRGFAINDFIRFKRETEQDDMIKDTDKEETKSDKDQGYVLFLSR